MFLRPALVLSFVLSIPALAAPPSGVVTTVAGQPGVPGYWDGPAQDAMFTHPTWLDVVVGSAAAHTCDFGQDGEIFVVDRMNQLVRHIAPNGFVSTYTFRPSFSLVPNLHLDFGSAFGGGVMVEKRGDGCGCSTYGRGVFFASTGTNQVILASSDGDLAARDDWSPVLGFNSPTGIARSKDVNDYRLRRVYVADTGSQTIRQISWSLSFEGCPQGKSVTILAGSPGERGSADGFGSAARFNTPRGVAVGPDNSIYVTDSGNHTVRKITREGQVTTIAGVPGVPGSDDTHLNTPSGIDVDANGNVFIVDTFNHAVRMLTPDGKLQTVAGRLGVSGFADGDAASALFNAPVGLKIAPDGSIVIADTGNNVIRRLTLTRPSPGADAPPSPR